MRTKLLTVNIMKITTLLITFLLTTLLHAQRTAPIAGDAATLIDLLQKDYSTGNPDTRQEDIARDRARVISIFKTYLDQELPVTQFRHIENLRLDYSKTEEAYKAMKRTDLNQTETKNLQTLKDSFTNARNEYFEALNENDENTFLTLINNWDDNEYIVEVLKKFKLKYSNLCEQKLDNYAITNSSLSIQKSLPFTGGDLLVDGIDGLSRFLAKRIKEELTLNAIQNIQAYLADKEKHPYLYELEVVLPTTITYLQSFDADQLLKFSDDLKQYIEEDLNHLVDNAANLRYTPRVAALIAQNPDLDFIFEGLEIVDQVTQIKSPVDYVEILSNGRNINRWRKEEAGARKSIAEGLQLAAMLAHSLTIIENAEVQFVTTDFMATYGSQLDFAYLYFGFLHQQNIKYYDIKYKTTSGDQYITHFVSSTDKVEEYHNFLKHELIPVVKNAERLHDQLIAIKKTSKNEDSLQYAPVHQLVEDLVSFAEEVSVSGDWILHKLDATTLGKAEKLTPYFETARMANNITLDLYEKRYTNAITKALEIPFIFKTNTTTQPDWLITYKNAFDTSAKLLPLQKILSMNQELSATEKLRLWNTNKVPLEILQLELVAQEDLKPLATSLNQFITTTPSNSWNDSLFQQNKATLIGALQARRPELLTYLKLNMQTFKEDLIKAIQAKKLNDETQKYIIGKLDTYTEKLYLNSLGITEQSSETLRAGDELLAAYQAFIPELLKTEVVKSKPDLVKLIHFVNDVAVSDSPEAYEKAIEAFVLPVGSSSLKEKAKSYYAINSFPGLLGGVEINNDIDNSGFIGFTAPVGLYLQPWGSGTSFINSFGIFLPLIDIAAPVRLRLDDSNETETLPDFEFKDILAPGAYLVFGIRNSPFAFNLGIQYGPKLRDIAIDNTGDVEDVESYRFGLGLTIDIPLVTLSSRYKN